MTAFAMARAIFGGVVAGGVLIGVGWVLWHEYRAQRLELEELGHPADRVSLDDVFEERCRMCGCTEDRACPDGCHWVEDPMGLGPLCSACEPGERQLLEEIEGIPWRGETR